MSINIEKNEEYSVEIVDNGCNGEGIAKIDNFTVFVDNAIKGEKCRVLIVKVNKNFAYGKVLEIVKKSNSRREPECKTYKRCGGCNLRHIDYDYTLKMKQDMVQNLVNKSMKNKVKVMKTIGMDNPYYYRNKLQYPVGRGKDGKNIMGVFANRTHDIIETDKCLIQNETAQMIANELLNIFNEMHISAYDEKSRKGFIRHVIVKIGIHTNEVMCVIVTNREDIEDEQYIVKRLTEKFTNIKSIIKNINSNNTNVILGDKNIVLYGNDYIEDRLGDYIFKISAKSFYQTNPVQTEVLYNKAIEGAKLKQDDILCDLYCGIGTIGIFASKYVKKVYGIEIVEEAIEMAKENARKNGIDNIEFMAGDVEHVFEKMLRDNAVSPSVIIVDPPRRGLDEHTINKLLDLEVDRIVYVSCNPATLTRDLSLLEDKYNVCEIQPVDMFPFTSHVECVTVLTLKN